MGFNKETAAEAGKISKRGSDKQIEAIRGKFNEILEDNINNVNSWLQQVAEHDPAKALDLLLKMSNMVVPKLRPVEVEQDGEKFEGFNVHIIRSGNGIDPEDEDSNANEISI